MKRSEMIDNIYKDLDESLTFNQIRAVLHLAEAYGMLPPDSVGDMSGCEWDEEDSLGPHKVIPAEDFDRLVEDLLADGVCPCGSDSYEGCSVTGCPLYCQQELKDEKK